MVSPKKGIRSSPRLAAVPKTPTTQPTIYMTCLPENPQADSVARPQKGRKSLVSVLQHSTKKPPQCKIILYNAGGCQKAKGVTLENLISMIYASKCLQNAVTDEGEIIFESCTLPFARGEERK